MNRAMGSGPILILGIGNTLRRDDGAGLLLASAAAELFKNEGYSVVEQHVHQLTPDLAAEIAETQPDLVLFTDVEIGTAGPNLTSLSGVADTSATGSHTSSPALILYLARELFAVSPSGWLLTVPGTDFGHGEDLSTSTQAAIPAATQLLNELTQNKSNTQTGNWQAEQLRQWDL